MKKLFKLTVITVLLLGIASIIFYKWASASTLPQESYSKLITTQIQPKLDNDSIYSIITYNVGYLSGMTNNKAVERTKGLFDTNLERLENNIRQSNPDIIAFQEIDFNADRSYNVDQMKAVSELGYPYAAQAINWDERYLPFPYGMPSKHFGKVISGQSINSKHKIISQERLVLQRVEDTPFYRDAFYLDRLAQVVKIDIEGKILVIINIHLEAFDKPTRDAQAKVVLELYKKYASDVPTILLGDFNSDPSYKDAAITQFLELNDTGNAAFTSAHFKNTFNSVMPTERIDYIFYNTKYIDYIDGKVLQNFSDISDHLPVEMSFRFKNL